jgi:hypothetical protein
LQLLATLMVISTHTHTRFQSWTFLVNPEFPKSCQNNLEYENNFWAESHDQKAYDDEMGII